jgi:hypothetical protein
MNGSARARIAVFASGALMIALSVSYPAQAQQVAPASRAPSLQALKAVRAQGARECVQPPRHLNLKSMSNAQLALYGLPGRQSLQRDHTLWSYLQAHYKHRSCGPVPAVPKLSLPVAKRGLPHPGIRPSVSGSGNVWAGNWSDSARGTYRIAQVSFTVPWLSSGTPTYSDVSLWAGVGGVQQVVGGSYGLVQAGVTVEKAPTSSGGTYLYNYAWWESVNSQYCTGPESSWPEPCFPEGMPLTIYPGNSMFAYAQSNYGGDGYNYYDVCNSTLNTCAQPEVQYGYFSDSATGECIAEEPVFSQDSNYYKANFGTENLDDCEITDNSGNENGVGNLPHNYYYLEDTGTGGTLVDVGDITNNGEDYAVNYCSTEGSGNGCG